MPDDEFKNIFKLAEQLATLQKQTVKSVLDVYEPVVEDIIQLNINDKHLIEKALDQLLDVAFDITVLDLFKRLCRHYYFINAETTVFYVNSYREMWDENSFETNAE